MVLFSICIGILLLVSIAMILKKMPPNRLFGFGAAAVATPEQWHRANAFAGWALLLSATVSAALILGAAAAKLSAVPVVLAVLVPIVIAEIASTVYLRAITMRRKANDNPASAVMKPGQCPKCEEPLRLGPSTLGGLLRRRNHRLGASPQALRCPKCQTPLQYRRKAVVYVGLGALFTLFPLGAIAVHELWGVVPAIAVLAAFVVAVFVFWANVGYEWLG